ncbi:CDP-diacylglycerol--serine O-phosphatidyltransferase [candidate division KSB1 bacterium]|nr:CDP-diacylglycerol--serine O-phosphatidyltransferase [candidate division KSB1 bacterium]
MAMKSKPNKYIIPNVFTAFNVFLGFLAILYAAKANSNKISVDPALLTACWLIILAAVFDTLDGKVARMTKTFSEFGVEFDSLADVVSFGVAPSILIYKLFFFQYEVFGYVLSFLPLLFGSIRLARFNVQISGFEKVGFMGLPIPSAAAGIATFVLLSSNEYFPFTEPFKTLFQPFLTPLVILLCFLMVSTLPYDILPKLSFKAGWGNILKLVYLFGGITLIIFFPTLVFFPLVMVYVLSGVVRWLLGIFKTSTEEAAAKTK